MELELSLVSFPQLACFEATHGHRPSPNRAVALELVYAERSRESKIANSLNVNAE